MRGSGKVVEGPVSKAINRPIADYLARLIASKAPSVTPNHVSLAAFALSIAAGVAAAMGKLQVAGVLVQASSIVDGVDGSLARVTGRATRSGGFLDTMLDRYSDIAVYLGLGYFLAVEGGGGLIPALVVLLALSADLMVSYLHARGERDLGVHPSLVGPLDSAASRDVRLFILFVALIAEAPLYGLLAVAGLGHIYVAVKSASVYINLKALDKQSKRS